MKRASARDARAERRWSTSSVLKKGSLVNSLNLLGVLGVVAEGTWLDWAELLPQTNQERETPS